MNALNEQLPLQKCMAGFEIRNLSDQELLSIIIGTGTRGMDVFNISSGLLNCFGGLSGLRRAGLREISKNHGIGLKKSIKIHAALELGRRVISDDKEIMKLDSPMKVWKLVMPNIIGLEREEFRVLVLNNKNNLVKNSVVSI